MEPERDIYLSLCDSGWTDVDVDRLKSKLDERIILKRFSEMDKIPQDLNFSFPRYKNKESKFQGDEVKEYTIHQYFSEYCLGDNPYYRLPMFSHEVDIFKIYSMIAIPGKKIYMDIDIEPIGVSRIGIVESNVDLVFGKMISSWDGSQTDSYENQVIGTDENGVILNDVWRSIKNAVNTNAPNLVSGKEGDYYCPSYIYCATLRPIELPRYEYWKLFSFQERTRRVRITPTGHNLSIYTQKI
jgi:hypothetical protein